MDPLSAFASIVAVLQLSAKVIGYLNDVNVASKERELCAIEVANLNSLLTVLRFRLEGEDTSTPWFAATRNLADENGPLDQFRDALEELQSGMTEGGTTKKFIKALVWKFRKEEIASILARVERLKTLVHVALQNDHFKLSQAIKECGDLTRSNTETIRNLIRQDLDIAKHDKLLAWLSSSDFPTQQSDFIRSKQEGTGRWFLATSQFRQWLNEPKGTLFCPGIPGAGKTMIAAIAIDHLVKTAQNNSVGVAYLYCNYKSQTEQDTSGLLMAVLKQLVQTHPALMQHAERLYAQDSSKATKPAVDEIRATLRSALADLTTFYIVVDALDECQDNTRSLLLASLRDLQADTDLRLMVTSRFIPAMNEEFHSVLRLEIRAGIEDVTQFLKGRISQLPRCIQRDAALQELVVSSIAEAVDGMYEYVADCKGVSLIDDRFLLARLHIDSLLDKRTPKEVKSTLANLPKGVAALDHAYNEAVERIENQLTGDSDRAKRVLSFITYAEGPLTVPELCSALAVELGTSKLDPENVADADDLVSVCAGVVVIDEMSGIIRLVHYTAQEYFERIGQKWFPGAQIDIASTCITYLCFSAFRSGSCPTDERLKRRLREHAFLSYAAGYWGKHTSTVQAELCELACGFLLHQDLITCAAQAVYLRHVDHRKSRFSGYSQRYNRKTTCLHVTAYFGLDIIAQSLFEKLGKDAMRALDSRNIRKQSPLHTAAAMGHLKMVRFLLGKTLGSPSLEPLAHRSSYIHSKDDRGRTALSWATVNGHVEVAKLLIEKGPLESERTRSHGVLPLCLAAQQDQSEILQILLTHGVTPDLQDHNGESAIAKAAREGAHSALERLLSIPDVNPNVRDYYGRSLLWWAAHGGFTYTFELLLDKYHVDPEVEDNFGRTPLTIASLLHYDHLVEILRMRKDNAGPDRTTDAIDISLSVATGFNANLVVGCDVCLLDTTEHYHCWTCAEGDFDICKTCYKLGARCLNPGHALVKRVDRGGAWVEVGESSESGGGAKEESLPLQAK